MSLPAGKYDFVTWCGVKDNASISFANSEPLSLTDLSLSLKLKDINGAKVSDSELPVIYHGGAYGVEVASDPKRETPQEVTLSLIRDTKNVCLVVQGKDMESFLDTVEFRIEDGNNLINWKNIAEATQKFYYAPYRAAIVFDPDEDYPGLTQGVNIIRADFDILPLSPNTTLVVTNKADGKELYRVNLTDHVLKGKPYDAPHASDKEYLEMQNNYRIIISHFK